MVRAPGRAARRSRGRAPRAGRGPTAPAGSTVPISMADHVGLGPDELAHLRGGAEPVLRDRPAASLRRISGGVGVLERRGPRARPPHRGAASSAVQPVRRRRPDGRAMRGAQLAVVARAGPTPSASAQAAVERLQQLGRRPARPSTGSAPSSERRPSASSGSSTPRRGRARRRRAGAADDGDDAAHLRRTSAASSERTAATYRLGTRQRPRARSWPERADGLDARRVAAASACPSVGASTITRTSGSVPLGRMQHPPVVAQLGLHRCDVRRRRRRRRRGPAAATRTLRSTCGRRVIAARPASASGCARRGDHVEQLHAGEQPVAGRGQVAEDHVAGLLAAERPAAAAERLEHVAVADGRLEHRRCRARPCRGGTRGWSSR